MKKILIIVSCLVVGWILYSFIIPVTILTIDAYRAKSSNSSLQLKLNQVETSDRNLPDQLNRFHCVGEIGTSAYEDSNNPILKPYYEKLKVVNSYNNISVCETAVGRFVLYGYYENAGSSQRADIYLDTNGDLKKLITFDDSQISMATDESNNVYFPRPFTNGPVTDVKVYIFDKEKQQIELEKKDKPIKICDALNGQENCLTYPTNANPFETASPESRTKVIDDAKGILELIPANLMGQPYSDICRFEEYNTDTFKKLSDLGGRVNCLSDGTSTYALGVYFISNNQSASLCADRAGIHMSNSGNNGPESKKTGANSFEYYCNFPN